MELNFSKEDLEFRDELRSWLANDYPKHVKDKQDPRSSYWYRCRA
jgi:hypothetical protein